MNTCLQDNCVHVILAFSLSKCNCWDVIPEFLTDARKQGKKMEHIQKWIIEGGKLKNLLVPYQLANCISQVPLIWQVLNLSSWSHFSYGTVSVSHRIVNGTSICRVGQHRKSALTPVSLLPPLFYWPSSPMVFFHENL